ncbi:MFS transporter [Modestobacter versicolor]|uniref:EmrB/QacA subfamily drug resistance transporter n=1 Tax=Modestobacter versicolor TaxID=429133 RepID=A0A323V8P0_9ACTN|nr:MFS transporter [Modestobacter versicolor]MBB3677202.1 EmrB/QacA subfamily drug resistance transporter [Modestobacter versicolor]PZA21162.1 MFS transporter [Modestobacter versicolor]
MSSTGRRADHRVTFAVLATGVIAFSLLQSLVTPVLPTLEAGLGTNQSDVTWVLTAYLLSASVFTPILGRLGDMTGKKRMFVVALAALALGCLLAALATDLTVMVVARVVQGIGGGVLPLAFGIIRDEFPRDRVAGAVGAISSLVAVGAGVGLVVAGPIVDAFSYHGLFWLPLVVLVVAALAAQFLVPESPERTAGSINWAAALLLSSWLVALLLAVSQAPSWGWGSAEVLGLLVAAVVLAVVWVLVESRAVQPLIDMRMMRVRAVWATNLVALLFGAAMYAAFAFLPQFLQTPSSAGYGFGSTVTESGLLMLPQTIASFVLGLVSGTLAQRIGSKVVLVIGTLVVAAGYLAFALAHDSQGAILAGSVVMGAGFGLAFAAMSNLIVAAVPPSQTGVASGMNANIRTIGGSIGAAVMASVVTAHAGAGGLPAESGYTNGFLMLTGALVAAALAALLIPAVRRDPATHAEPDVALRHPEAALVAGGTLVGDDPE